MSETIELYAELRSDTGKGASRRLRRLADQVPAIIYGGDKDPVNLSFSHNKVIKALEHESFYSSILSIDVAGKKEKAVLKAMQRHPARPRIQHMDLLRINENEPIIMHVPVHFIGEEDAPGVKDDGGVFSKNIADLEIKCLPKDLPEYIEVDISHLELDHALHLSDVKLPHGVALLVDIEDEDHNLPIASIHLPRKAIEEEAVATEEAAAGEEAAAEGTEEEKTEE